ncbi:MAG: ABC transporter permease [Actinomycetota bacterium]|nr:ABC transporter permease [Actinomycetota bacterium]
MGRLRIRFWSESLSALTCGVLTILTTSTRDWLEITGRDPDQHSGSAEWALIAVFALVTVTSSALAGREWRRRPEPA